MSRQKKLLLLRLNLKRQRRQKNNPPLRQSLTQRICTARASPGSSVRAA